MKFILFITKPYSVSILEPIAHLISQNSDLEFRWVKANGAKDCLVPGTHIPFEEVNPWKPDVILVPGNVVPYEWPGMKVQIFHGLGEEKQGHYRITGFFDLYCTPGPYITNKFLALRKKHPHFFVRETGWPKLDLLNSEDVRSKRKQELGLDPEKPVILFAPTFSPKLTSAPALFSVIKELEKRPYQWICKFHSLMDPVIINQYQSLQLPSFIIPKTENILPLMEASDILLTDTSSVAYEFLFLDRPIITFKAKARPEKGIDISDPNDLDGAIYRSLNQPAEFSKIRRDIIAELHPYLDRNSSGRVISAIQEIIKANLLSTLRPKPANRFRKWQTRRLFRG